MREAFQKQNAKIISQSISTSGRHLLTLINDILDISKIEAGHLLVETVRCSPHQIIAEVVSVLRVPAQEKGVCLDYRWESGVPESILSDPLRLKQLLMNLLGNAIKFTEQGSVIVVASLDANKDAQLLHIEVRDTGMGIAADKLDMIFEPFAQADSSVTRKHGGTGLGLAISQRIVEALGGELHVDERGRPGKHVLRDNCDRRFVDLDDSSKSRRRKSSAT